MTATCMVENVNLNPELEWVKFLTETRQDFKNATHTILTNSLDITEKHDARVFRCKMTAADISEDNDCFLESIKVIINVRIFISDNLQVGQSAVFQCKTGHDCQQCEYNWTITNTNLLVNISEPHLNLTITDDMIDRVLVCHVTSNKIHGSGEYMVQVNNNGASTAVMTSTDVIKETEATNGQRPTCTRNIISILLICLPITIISILDI